MNWQPVGQWWLMSCSINCQDHMLSSSGTRWRHRADACLLTPSRTAIHRCLGLYTALQVFWPVRLIQRCELCIDFLWQIGTFYGYVTYTQERPVARKLQYFFRMSLLLSLKIMAHIAASWPWHFDLKIILCGQSANQIWTFLFHFILYCVSAYWHAILI